MPVCQRGNKVADSLQNAQMRDMPDAGQINCPTRRRGAATPLVTHRILGRDMGQESFGPIGLRPNMSSRSGSETRARRKNRIDIDSAPGSAGAKKVRDARADSM